MKIGNFRIILIKESKDLFLSTILGRTK